MLPPGAIRITKMCYSSKDNNTQSLRVVLLKNEFDQTNDIYPVTPTHLGTKNQLTVKSKISGFMKKWHVSIFYNNVVQNTYVVCPT